MFDDEKPTYPVSREKLYEMAWSEPMTAIGKYFDVSSSYLARVYAHLNVPRPAPGYWAKIAHGKPASKPALPAALPGQELGWDRNNDQALLQPPKPTPPRVPARRAPQLKERTDRPEIHPLLRGAKEHFLKSRDSDLGYLRPYKRRLVDLFVSKAGLDKGLEIANTLFLVFEDHGYRVSFPPNLHMFKRDPVDEREKPPRNGYRYGCDWSPDRGTIVHVGEVAIGLSLFEISESIEVRNVNGEYIPVATLKQKSNRLGDIGWTTHKDYPTGRFCLQAYSPYRETTWLQRWPLPESADCAAVAQKIAKELHGHAVTIAVQAAQAHEAQQKREEEWEEQRRKWQIEEEIRKRKEATDASRLALMKAIDHWQEQRRIETFFAEVEEAAKAQSMDQQQLFDRLGLARALIGAADPLQKLREWRSPQEILEGKKS
jgi:hypothetical protein